MSIKPNHPFLINPLTPPIGLLSYVKYRYSEHIKNKSDLNNEIVSKKKIWRDVNDPWEPSIEVIGDYRNV
jgi:hypothetical protein